MTLDCDKVSSVNIKPDFSKFNKTKSAVFNDTGNEGICKSKIENTISKYAPVEDGRKVVNETIVQNEAAAAAEKRQRTGRYLAIGVTLVMIFIAFYHTLLRHATVLAGLLAPAIIMLLYILWLFYFAKKKKAAPVSAV